MVQVAVNMVQMAVNMAQVAVNMVDSKSNKDDQIFIFGRGLEVDSHDIEFKLFWDVS